jgi:flagellar secretion chaperone FliS
MRPDANVNPRLDQYFEAEVLNADPVKLVSLLYRGARTAVTAATVALSEGNIPERSKQILKAWEIVQELSGTLNHEQGGEISRQLAELYAYIGQRLLDANAEQAVKPLEDAAAVLAILADAWNGLQARPLSVAC